MVHNPKHSQDFMYWCVDTALNLIINAVIYTNDKLQASQIPKYFSDNLAGQNVSDRQVSQMIYELKRNNYIRVDDSDSVILTNKAKIKMIDKFCGKVDGKIRLVSFDIPETLKVKRNGFRRAIKKLGFAQIQKSLWVCNQNIGEMVEIIAEEFGVAGYVAYFVIDKSNIENHIQKIISKKIKYYKLT